MLGRVAGRPRFFFASTALDSKRESWKVPGAVDVVSWVTRAEKYGIEIRRVNLGAVVDCLPKFSRIGEA